MHSSLFIGHCSMIGEQTGSVIGWSVRSKFCKLCDEATRKGQQPKSHDCRKKLVKKFQGHGA